MTLSAVIQNLESIPEALRTEYVEQQDGTYRLDIEGGFKTSDEVGGLYKALESERGLHKEALKKFKPFEGLNPDEVKRALDAFANLDADKKKAAEDLQSTIKAHVAPEVEARTKAESERDEYRNKYRTARMENAFANSPAIKELCDPKVLPSTIRLTLEAAGHVAWEGDELVARDADGSTVLDINGKPDLNRGLHKVLTTSPHAVPFLKKAEGSNIPPGAGGARPGRGSMTRDAFEALDPSSKVKAMSEGVSLTD